VTSGRVGLSPKQFSAIERVERRIGINAAVNQVSARCGARTSVFAQSRKLRPPAEASGPLLSDFPAMATATASNRRRAFVGSLHVLFDECTVQQIWRDLQFGFGEG
jgi:hypothetical protein